MKKIILFIICGMLFLSGCTSLRLGQKGSDLERRGLEVASTLRFEDVPVPFGFKMDKEKSFVFQNNDTRVGLLRYSGRVDADQTVLFYKYQMPLYKWDLVNIVEYGRKILNFERKSQSCIVTIDRGATKTYLTVSVGERAKKVIRK